MASSSLRLPPFVPQYKGEESNTTAWGRWIEEFELYLAVTKITSAADRLNALLFHGGVRLRELIKATKDSGDETIDTYLIVKARLEKHFQISANVYRDEFVFRKLSQGVDETFPEFSCRVKNAVSSVDTSEDHPNTLADRLVIMQCIVGSKSDKVRELLLGEKILTFDLMNAKIIAHEMSIREMPSTAPKETAIKEEAVCAIRTNSQRPPYYRGSFSQPQRGNFQQRTDQGQRETIQRTCFGCGRNFHPQGRQSCPAYNEKCHVCDRVGHFARVCRGRGGGATQQRGGSNQQQRGGVIASVFDEERKEEEQPTERAHVYAVNLNRQREVDVMIEGKKIKMIVDTGSAFTILPERTVKMWKTIKLRTPDTVLYGFGSRTPLPLAGMLETNIGWEGNNVRTKIYIVSGDVVALLGGTDAETLQIITFNVLQIEGRMSFQPREEFSSLFKGLGKFKGPPVRLTRDMTIPPVAITNRKIPFHRRDKVEEEIQRLCNADIIEAVVTPSRWISPIVVVPKKNGAIRLCVDSRWANMAILRKRVSMPTYEDLTVTFNGCCFFSKVDLREGYHQLVLHPDDREVTTFATHHGLWQFTRVSFGINAAADIFQETIAGILPQEAGVANVLDDILVGGRTMVEHDKRLRKVLIALEKWGLTLNDEKCVFGVTTITFFGHVFSDKGVDIDPEKIVKLQTLEKPKCAGDVSSALGMFNYCSKFIPDLAELSLPLRKAIRGDKKFEWSATMETAWTTMLKRLDETPTLGYFREDQDSVIVVDAGPTAVAAIFFQEDKDGKPHLRSYYSRLLSDTETRYPQIDREMVGVVAAVLHFQIYLLGKPFKVITDHEPLVTLLNNPNSTLPTRVQRLQLKLQEFQMTFQHISGKNNPSDYISRHPLTTNKPEDWDLEEYVRAVVEGAVPKAMSREEIASASREDEQLREVYRFLLDNQKHSRTWKENIHLKGFRDIWTELTTAEDGVILRGTKVVIPEILRSRVVRLAHEGHQGITKTKALLRGTTWFPGMDDLVEKEVRKCIDCCRVTKQKSCAPLTMTETPPGPWEWVSFDFLDTNNNQYFLVGVDMFSKFPVVERVKTTNFECTKKAMDRVFATWGLPTKVFVDNGPPFSSTAFREYADIHGFEIRANIPIWPKSNGQGERAIGSLEKIIRIAIMNDLDVDDQIQKYLLQHRQTAHKTTGKAPVEYLLKYTPRWKLDTKTRTAKREERSPVREKNIQRMKEDWERRRRVGFQRFEQITAGAKVFKERDMKTKWQSCYETTPFEVIKREGERITIRRGEQILQRHVSKVKLVPGSEEGKTIERPTPQTITQQEPERRTSERQGKGQNVTRFQDYVRH